MSADAESVRWLTHRVEAIDDESWAIRHLVIDARRWWLGGRVLIEPAAVADISWDEQCLRVRLTLKQANAKQVPAGE